MEKIFVRITDWIKDKDPKRVVDIASKKHCMCCAIEEIPEDVKGMWVVAEQVALMKEAIYATHAFRAKHQNSEIIWLLDLQPTIDVGDLVNVLSNWDLMTGMKITIELEKFFKLNGLEIKSKDLTFTDDQIDWINQRSDDLFDLADIVLSRPREVDA